MLHFLSKEETPNDEVTEFYTLLHTTLKHADTNQDNESPPDTPHTESPTNDDDDVITTSSRNGALSPVEELSESTASTVTSSKVVSFDSDVTRDTSTDKVECLMWIVEKYFN